MQRNVIAIARSRRLSTTLLWLLLAAALSFGSQSALAQSTQAQSTQASMPLPPQLHAALKRFQRPTDIPFRLSESVAKSTRQKLIDAGRFLFFDPRLSRSGLMSCATCHNPSFHWTDSLSSSIENSSRRSMCLYNLAWDRAFIWQGNAGSIMSQAVLALTAPTGMNASLELVESRVNAVPYYQKILGEVQQEISGKTTTVHFSTVGLALEYFVTTITSPIAPFDRWVAGEERALSEAEKRGFLVFLGKGGCATCHSGWRFSDGNIYDIGLPSLLTNPTDKKDPRFYFKAVGLRNIAERPPYMHTGSLKTLREVIEFYNRGGDAQRPSKSERIHPLHLSEQEKVALEAFLRTLSGTPTPVPFPILPR